MRALRASWVAVSVSALVAGSALADTMANGDPATNFTVADYVTGLTQPTSLAFLPDGRMLITEKGGDLILADATGATTQTVGTFEVNTNSEQGLLHVLVHPDFATNHLLIFYYSRSSTAATDPGTNTDRHRIVTVPFVNDALDMTKETILVRGLQGPANHDGGALAIGPDGKLYIGDGDTGHNSNKGPVPSYTPTNFFGTCLTVPNGKILRVNLDGSIPSDNPLVGKKVNACTVFSDDPRGAPVTANAREDIWAWGFRNPWRFSFDPKTGNLWVGDVGEVTYEEIDVIPQSGKGSHFGWPFREGGDVTGGASLQGHPLTECDSIDPTKKDCIDPKYFCKHGGAVNGVDGNCTAIMGGVLVDSCTFPTTFQGLYYFGDNSQNWVATLQPTADRSGIVAGSRQMFVNASGGPTHFEIGPDGNLYYTEIVGGGTSTVEVVKPKNPITCTITTGTGGASGSGGTTAGTGGTSGGGTTASSGGTSSSSGGATASAGGSTGVGGATSGGGTTASGGGTTSGGGATSGGGVPTGNEPDGSVPVGSGQAKSDSGCGCHTAARSTNGSAALLGLAGLALLRRRRSARARR